MTNKIWLNRTYGTLEKGGLTRAIDYNGDESRFADIHGAMLFNSEEMEIGRIHSPIHVTGTDRVTGVIGGVTSISGTNELIAAPGAGHRILVTSFVIQNEDTLAVTMLLRSGATANGWRYLGQSQGDSLSKDLPSNSPWQLNENEALNFTLVGANVCGYSVQYVVNPV